MSESNLWRKFEALVKPIAIIAAAMALIFYGLSKEANASETSVAVGAGFLSGEYSDGGALVLSEKWGKYSLSVGYIMEQEVTDRSGKTYELRENVFISGMRHVRPFEKLDMGIGVAYFNGTNRALGSEFNFSLEAKWLFSDRMAVSLRHFSNAGSQRPNMGQDLILVHYTF